MVEVIDFDGDMFTALAGAGWLCVISVNESPSERHVVDTYGNPADGGAI